MLSVWFTCVLGCALLIYSYVDLLLFSSQRPGKMVAFAPVQHRSLPHPCCTVAACTFMRWSLYAALLEVVYMLEHLSLSPRACVCHKQWVVV